MWIEKAKILGQSNAQAEAADRQQKYKDKDAFEAEKPVTADALASFLAPREAPVNTVVQELIQAGYSVTKNGPGELLHSSFDVWKPEVIASYPLTTIKEDPSKSHGNYVARYDYVFGTEWEVTDPEGVKIGTIRLYPTVSEKTHYAGVQYTEMFGNGAKVSEVVSSAESLSPEVQTEIAESLRGMVGTWISAAEAKKAGQK